MSKRLLIIFLVSSVFLMMIWGCSFTAVRQVDMDNTATDNDYPDSENRAAMSKLLLFFCNLDFDPLNPVVEALIPVTRYLPQTESVARTSLMELFSGPQPLELKDANIGPVIDVNLFLDDIYIVRGLCVIHWFGDTAPFINQPYYQADLLFVQSVVKTLTSNDEIDAVWIFEHGAPWESESGTWLAPLNQSGKSLNYTVYLKGLSGANLDDPLLGAGGIQPVTVPISYTVEAAPGETSFHQIINIMQEGYGEDYGPVIPVDNHVLGLTLQDRLLTITLSGSIPGGNRAVQQMVEALVYTFTELPEIEWVLVNLEDEPWTDGHFTWDTPLSRENLE